MPLLPLQLLLQTTSEYDTFGSTATELPYPVLLLLLLNLLPPLLLLFLPLLLLLLQTTSEYDTFGSTAAELARRAATDAAVERPSGMLRCAALGLPAVPAVSAVSDGPTTLLPAVGLGAAGVCPHFIMQKCRRLVIRRLPLLTAYPPNTAYCDRPTWPLPLFCLLAPYACLLPMPA